MQLGDTYYVINGTESNGDAAMERVISPWQKDHFTRINPR